MLTQGRGDGKEWVTGFLLSYSRDGDKWEYVAEENDVSRVTLIIDPVCSKEYTLSVMEM